MINDNSNGETVARDEVRVASKVLLESTYGCFNPVAVFKRVCASRADVGPVASDGVM